MENKKELSPAQPALPAGRHEELIGTLKARFEKNMNRHKGIEWANVQAKLDLPAGEVKLWSLNEMERTGGEPDVVGYDEKTGCLPACRNIFFMIVRQKVPKAAEVFVTTVKGWCREKNINRQTALLVWHSKWALNF